ncbi:MAG TPA: chemotaxis-specific protein-glutamate methyltransferase CheB [Candidatus Wallbacteria bacterium]|nr:chemotaxis-specific protein-glutamate methyltransferase CheB [Candidatus Wallbacteria bacterium]
MMEKKKIFIIDDDVITRRAIINALSSDGTFEVSGFASDANIGIAKIQLVEADAVVMSLGVKDMGGLELLSNVIKYKPAAVIILMVNSGESSTNAKMTFDALNSGAKDYVMKPSGPPDNAAITKLAMDEIIPKIKLYMGYLKYELIPKPAAISEILPGLGNSLNRFGHYEKIKNQKIDIIAIGVSTGGPEALLTLLSGFPKNFNVPIVVVQHMPVMFTKILAERLSANTGLFVLEACHGMRLDPGKIYIAPGNYHMTVGREGITFKISLNQGAYENSCRPSVDPLFRSVSETYGKNVLAVILTGMGQDGYLGSEVIVRNGGRVIAQDRETSVVWGMPGAVVEAGLADAVLPINNIAFEIFKRVNNGFGSI